ncbi:MAG: Rid family detoxifying hydrolase [Bacteroidota bacterium]
MRTLRLIPFILLTALFACQAPPATPPLEVQYLTSPAKSAANPPYSEVVKVGQMLFLSGQLGYEPGTRDLPEGGIRAETRNVLQNIETTLKQHGADLNSVVKVNVYLADIEDYAAMNEVYRGFFTEHFPARTTLAVAGVPRGARLEVECVAVVE